jgi:ribosome-binding protein aMBF1 (putative translation factor)
MSVLDMWSVCDRCGFDYKRRDLRKETTNFVVCMSCYDGRFDKKSHPQNYSAKPRRELKQVPDARPDQTNYGS